MKKIKRLFLILKRTGGLKLLISFILLSFASSIILYFFEPNIKTIHDALWYCFIASTTIGFGDICATSFIGRLVTIIVSLNGILVTAVITGVVVSYYMEFLKERQDESISLFLEKLENLPNLSKEELKKISEKIRKIKNG